MITCVDPKELRSNWAPWCIPKGEPASFRGGGSDSAACGSLNPGGASGSHLHAMGITPKLSAPLGSEASSRWLGACTAVGSLPGALVHWLVTRPLLQGLGKLWPPLWPPTWRHLTCHHSWGEVHDTCEDPGLCHRVSQRECPIVQCTTGGPRPVPLFHLTSQLRCPLGLRS